MRKKILLSLFLIAIPIIISAQFTSGVVYKKDGSEIKGLIKIKENRGIKFKEKEKSKVKHYNHKNILGFNIFKYQRFIEYVYRKTKGGHNYQLLETLQKGKITLYKLYQSEPNLLNSLIRGGNKRGNLHQFNNFHYISSDTFYVEKYNHTFKIDYRLREKMEYLFNDCPKLLKSIKDGYFGKEKKIWKNGKIKDIIDVYNKCK